MGKASLILVGVLIVLVLGVVVVYFQKSKKLSPEIINLEEKSLPSGIYYKYNEIEIENIEEILKSLEERNVLIIEAWYKPYASSCCPPQQQEPIKCMNVIVEPVLLIKVEKETELENFIRVDVPDLGICKYYVKEYKIK
mgnify:CR=1 FL=1